MWSQIVKFIFSQTKYLFYYLEIILLPTHFYRFFFKYDDYSLLTILKFVFAAFLVAMAYWSHSTACKGNDPGFLVWENFRS
jgi:hypothetical protein